MFTKKMAAFVGVAAQFGFSAVAVPQVEILAIEDGSVPEVAGEFYDHFGLPVIDDAGVVYFKAGWGGAFEDGGLFASENGTESMLVREGFAIAGLSFTVGRFYDVAVSPAGLNAGIAGVVSVRGGGATTEAIIRIDSDGVRCIHLDGEPVPVGIGTGYIRNGDALSIGKGGDIAYSVSLGGTPGGSSDDRALFQYIPVIETYSEIVHEGDLYPEADGVFEGICGSSQRLFCTPLLNEFGDAAFIASGGVFVNDGATTHTAVRFGEPIGDGQFDNLSFPKINNIGEVAFSADIQGSSSFDAVFIESGGVLNGAPLGGFAPTTSGGLFGTFRSPVTTSVHFNNRGEVSFGTDTTEVDSQGNGRRGEGLFVFDGTSIISVARKYEEAPGGGKYKAVHNGDTWMMNDGGQVLFWATVELDDSEIYETIFLYTPGEGARKLLARGDIVEGRVVTDIYDFDSGFAAAGALNVRGEVVVRVRFDGSRDAVVLIDGVPLDCLADLTGDGGVNFFDVSAFLLAFTAQEPIADFTDDGAWNFFDVSAFLLAFAEGCP